MFVRDLSLAAVELISVPRSGLVKGHDHSWLPKMSNDGQYVAFGSYASLDSLDTNRWADIYVRDRKPSGPTTTLISINSLGTAAGDNDCGQPWISHDGSTVAFASYASDLDGTVTDTNGMTDVFVRNWQAATPTTRLVSRDNGGSASGNSYSCQVELSDDGGRLVFTSQATDLVAAIADVNGSAGSDQFAFDGSRVTLVSQKGEGSFTTRSGWDILSE